MNGNTHQLISLEPSVVTHRPQQPRTPLRGLMSGRVQGLESVGVYLGSIRGGGGCRDIWEYLVV